jgi:hypothetical protein
MLPYIAWSPFSRRPSTAPADELDATLVPDH